MIGDEPRAGYFKTRLVKAGPWVAVRLWFGPPVVDGEELDRSPRWCAEVDGRTTTTERDWNGYRCSVPIDVHTVWPHCGRYPIPEHEYRYMVDVSRWAKTSAPERPEASPRSPVRLDEMKAILPPR